MTSEKLTRLNTLQHNIRAIKGGISVVESLEFDKDPMAMVQFHILPGSDDEGFDIYRKDCLANLKAQLQALELEFDSL